VRKQFDLNTDQNVSGYGVFMDLLSCMPVLLVACPLCRRALSSFFCVSTSWLFYISIMRLWNQLRMQLYKWINLFLEAPSPLSKTSNPLTCAARERMSRDIDHNRSVSDLLFRWSLSWRRKFKLWKTTWRW